jgi:hypothetical protein
MREVAEGERIPRGFGLAYYRHYSQSAVFAPWGLHFLIGAWNRIWWTVRGWHVPDQWETHRNYWMSKGYAEGRNHGEAFAARIFRDLAREKGWDFYIPEKPK